MTGSQTGTSAHSHPTGDTGPGIIETSLVLVLSVLLAVAIIGFFGGPLADVIGFLVDAASSGGE